MQTLKTHRPFHRQHHIAPQGVHFDGKNVDARTQHTSDVARVMGSSQESDNNWQLNSTPDGTYLTSFWSKVVHDVERDPTWIDFTNE